MLKNTYSRFLKKFHLKKFKSYYEALFVINFKRKNKIKILDKLGNNSSKQHNLIINLLKQKNSFSQNFFLSTLL